MPSWVRIISANASRPFSEREHPQGIAVLAGPSLYCNSIMAIGARMTVDINASETFKIGDDGRFSGRSIVTGALSRARTTHRFQSIRHERSGWDELPTQHIPA